MTCLISQASFFPEQDLHVLPTPAPIPGLPLGERFLSKLTPVCGALLGAVPVKQILGRNLDSAMLLDVARNYVADVNATLPFCIPKAYDHMCLSRCKLAVQRAQGHYAKQRQTFRACLPTSHEAPQQSQGEGAQHRTPSGCVHVAGLARTWPVPMALEP